MKKTSSGDGKHPYLYNRVKSPNTEKDRNINHCNDVYDRIRANWEAQAIRVNNNGIELN